MSERERRIVDRRRAAQQMAGIVPAGQTPAPAPKSPRRRLAAKLLLVAFLVVAACVAFLIVEETGSSRLQARYFAERAQQLTFSVEAGKAESVRFPHPAPYDERLGYSEMPRFLKSLEARGYAVTHQARASPELAELTDEGLFAIYREKDRAGLSLRDCAGQSLYSVRFPERFYEGFEAIPPVLVETLLFIEDQDLLDPRYPMHNPAIAWKRFGLALLEQLWRLVDRSHPAPGASTLATQIEKYRHSPDGRTTSPREKLRQMAAASLRAYLGGEETLAARRQIVVAYLNTVPLSAKPGYGEINSLGDGLWAWYGRDFAEVNRLLHDNDAAGEGLARKAEAFKQALSLMIAQRRPSYYLDEGTSELESLTNSYLRLLAADGVIPPALRDAALPVDLELREAPLAAPPASFVTRKAATAMRTHLSSLLGVPRLYDLDRLDLDAVSTLSGAVQYPVTQVLRDLRDPARAKEQGLYGFRMLNPGDDPGRITFSFTLFESTGTANLLRVQTDNFDQPFDVNEGARLNLGSTAKLRTLVLYLEIAARLHERYAGMSRGELSAVEVDRKDALTAWALEYLASAADRSLPAMLEAAMQRRYSASPAEAFFTGGGVQRFENFDPKENHQAFPVREAFRNSVNLVFIRLMRDIVRYYASHTYAPTARLLQDSADPRRREFLSRFADREGREFIGRFYRKYRGKDAAQALEMLLETVRPTPRRLAAAFRTIEPQAGPERLGEFLRESLPHANLTGGALNQLYESTAPGKLSLADRGFLAGVHPLELWTVGFLRRNPGATLAQTVEASRDERQDVYGWLFRTRHKNAQDSRIQSLLEVEAFLEIGRDWRRLGYPFESLTPSYAASIGASGDRPAALATLMGIIVNKGMRLPVERIDSLHFAAVTPYETRLEYRAGKAERVLKEEVAEVARRALMDVVEAGTARRFSGGFVPAEGVPLEVGGKTGTGDHRYEVYGRGGRLLESRVVNRSATFVFFMGDRYFGTITAYVPEPHAAKFRFTSSLTVQLLKSLTPALKPLVRRDAGAGQSACAR